MLVNVYFMDSFYSMTEYLFQMFPFVVVKIGKKKTIPPPPPSPQANTKTKQKTKQNIIRTVPKSISEYHRNKIKK